ncbi:hypothetical protein IFM89_026133 [Coptis chinensis]|uniref:PPM-type phosphatase domain-containing protein n=1 Tax=Coptis chinensis TaxID=261450 RepID=A0A835IHB5_9MAGN|nr:hypothetical protein IFM89_026133 [Coptis chinensis]
MGNCTSFASSEVKEDNDTHDNVLLMDETVHSNGCPKLVSIYSQQGTKEKNQDSALFYQGFGTEEQSFCGVFDGHGMNGHIVSKLVRNRLPGLILRQQKAFADEDYEETSSGEPVSSSEWRRACVSAFKVMDKEIKREKNLDCSWSGTTAVTIIMQGKDLIISNLGDSRAILGTISRNDELTAVQLTTDLKPDLPNESERIKKCNGRIFALQAEPSIQRVWLPNDDFPGIAMSRSFGDFGIKNYGIIAIPQMSFRGTTNKDQFVVLATDGVWDVLTNNEVASIVWSVKNGEKAAIAVVHAAVSAWKQRYPSTKIDDCTVICVFLQERSQDIHIVCKDNTSIN